MDSATHSADDRVEILRRDFERLHYVRLHSSVCNNPAQGNFSPLHQNIDALARARGLVHDTDVVEFSSVTSLLRHIGYSDQTANRERARRALADLGERGSAFRDVAITETGRIVMKLDRREVNVSKTEGYTRVPLPLPNKSVAACNLYLVLCAWYTAKRAPIISTPAMCKKIGLNTKRDVWLLERDLRRAKVAVERHIREKLDHKALGNMNIFVPLKFKLDSFVRIAPEAEPRTVYRDDDMDVDDNSLWVRARESRYS
jgi:hypothetical protein